VILDMYAIR